MASSFKSLTEEDEFTDCSIRVESKIFRCHKVILGVASEFFKRSFLSGFKESTTGEVVLTNVKADIFEKFRLYVYTYDRKTLESYSIEVVLSLKECANMWMVEPLQKACSEIITKRLHQMQFSDLLLCFEFAHHVTDKQLIEEAGVHLRQRHMQGTDFPEDVYHLGSDVFREFIKLTTNVEIIRYRTVERYVAIHGFIIELESQKRKTINIEYVKSLLSLIKFKNMTPKEFYDGPGKSKIMTFEEKFNMLYSIVRDNN
ncbi:hypothetical protein KR032_003506, partial [Drosophila birchii]